MTPSWTVRSVLDWTRKRFEDGGIYEPRFTAERLLACAIGVTRVQLYMDPERPLDENERTAMRGLVRRRLSGEPTQYLLGRTEFLGHAFATDARALIPRPETELLVLHCLEKIAKGQHFRFLDLGTGSGCIAVSIAKDCPTAEIWAVDCSAAALSLAKENAQKLGVDQRIQWSEGDLYASLPEGLRFDYVCANPPYIATSAIEALEIEVRAEPRVALDGGIDGLQIVKRIVEGFVPRSNPGAWLALEIGDDQGIAVRELLVSPFFQSTRILQDWSGRDRFALCQRLPSA